MINRRLKILLIIFPVLLAVAIPVNIYLYSMNRQRILLETFQVEGYTVRTLKFREDDGRLRGLCAIYWKDKQGKSVPLAKADIDKILDANAPGCWTLVGNDDLYMRFAHRDKKAKATYRKLDHRLCLFSADFVEWRNSEDFSGRDAELFRQIVE